MLTNLYIEDILSKLIPNFGGVWSSNNIPDLSETCSSVVVNFSKKGMIGTHFIAFKLHRKNHVYIIDSVNTHFDVLPEDIRNWMKGQGKKSFIKYYDRKIQSDSSEFCGFYTIYALLELDKKSRRLKYNTRALNRNDEKCIEGILKIIRGMK